jgi:NDP-sugar pyrophosphorylase family protein
LAGYSLAALAALGCRGTALNLHHLGDQIVGAFGTSFRGMPLIYSPEEELQGTLGALAPLRGYLSEADLVLLINGDSLCRWPLSRLVKRHLKLGADATLLLSKRADPSLFGGGVGIDERGLVRSFRNGKGGEEVKERLVFAGAHVLSPGLLERIGPGPADIVGELYEKMLAEGGRIGSLITSRPWFDLGTPERYLEAVLERRRGMWWRRIGSGWPGRTGKVDPRARVRKTVLEKEVTIEAEASVRESVLLDNSRVGSGSSIRRCVLGPGVEIPAGSRVEGRLVTLARAGVATAKGDSTLGGLVYTPLQAD